MVLLEDEGPVFHFQYHEVVPRLLSGNLLIAHLVYHLLEAVLVGVADRLAEDERQDKVLVVRLVDGISDDVRALEEVAVQLVEGEAHGGGFER